MSDGIYTIWLDFEDEEVAISLDTTRWDHALGKHRDLANPLCAKCQAISLDTTRWDHALGKHRDVANPLCAKCQEERA